MNKNPNHDDVDDASSSSTKKLKTCDNNVVTLWLNLNHDVLLFIMTKLRVIDFLPFSSVCKFWRSFALSNKNTFMASKPPMQIYMSRYHLQQNYQNYGYMEDFEGRKFEIVFPCSDRVNFFGVTCGYLILYRKSRRDFWLVNPITGHQLHFPAFHFHTRVYASDVKTILVFSRSMSTWVFVVTYKLTNKISYYVTGKRGWNHVESTLPILDLHAFKGKIYTLHTDCFLGEFRLDQKPNLLLHENKNFPKPDLKFPEFVSSGDHFYITSRCYASKDEPNKLLELDLDEMKWVSPDKSIGKYAFFVSNFKNSAAIRRETWDWANPETKDKIFDYLNGRNCPPVDKTGKAMFFSAVMWYFPHESLDVSLIDEC